MNEWYTRRRIARYSTIIMNIIHGLKRICNMSATELSISYHHHNNTCSLTWCPFCQAHHLQDPKWTHPTGVPQIIQTSKQFEIIDPTILTFITYLNSIVLYPDITVDPKWFNELSLVSKEMEEMIYNEYNKSDELIKELEMVCYDNIGRIRPLCTIISSYCGLGVYLSGYIFHRIWNDPVIQHRWHYRSLFDHLSNTPYFMNRLLHLANTNKTHTIAATTAITTDNEIGKKKTSDHDDKNVTTISTNGGMAPSIDELLLSPINEMDLQMVFTRTMDWYEDRECWIPRRGYHHNPTAPSTTTKYGNKDHYNEVWITELGGQRHRRKNWHRASQEGKIVYVVNLSAIDVILFEDKQSNRMLESMNAFPFRVLIVFSLTVLPKLLNMSSLGGVGNCYDG
jgi:hypothetical protein